MFVLCPHCQFLVALEASGQPPALCPRCRNPLQAPAPPAGEALEVASPTAPPSAHGDPSGLRQDADAVEATDIETGVEEACAAAAAIAAPDPSPQAANTGSSADALVAPTPDLVLEPAAATPHPPAMPGTAPADDATPDTAPATTQASPPDAPPAGLEAMRAATPASDTGPRDEADADAIALPATTAAPALPSGAEAASPGTEDASPPHPEATAEAVPSAGQTSTSAAAPARARAVPSFAHPRATRVARPRWPVLATIAGLSLLLVLQLLLADRARLATDARWRPLLASLCAALPCALPAWHEPDAFTLLARDVRPARAGVLHVAARFRNDARWPQRWPALHLALQDVDGRTVGARTLQARDYLADARITQNELAPGHIADVAFDIAEPQATVVAFTFEFR